MKKVGLTGFLVIVTACCMSFCLTACSGGGNNQNNNSNNQGNTEQGGTEQGGNQEHTHTYGEWKFNETQHWHECSVCGDKKDVQDHTMVNNECSVCGKLQSTQGLEFRIGIGMDEYAVTGIGAAIGPEIVIPSEYNGLPVTQIYYAFKDCNNITKVTIPDSVIYIDSEAFEGTAYYNDESNWEDGVLYIGKHLIAAKGNCVSCTVKEGTLTIADGAFSDCESLTNVTIPDSVTCIGKGAFEGTAYYNDESNWEDGVLYVGKHLIAAKKDISGNYLIKDGTLTICDEAFRNCESLSSIIIPDSVTKIQYETFYGCNSLTNVKIGNGVTNIDIEAFDCCTSLTSVTIPNGITRIGYEAFKSCSSLKEIIIPDSVTYIGPDAFKDTAYFDDENNWENGVLYIGKHLISVQTAAEGNLSIKKGTVNVASYAFVGCTNLTGITIPDSAKAIGYAAFLGCNSLKSLTIPSGVAAIGFMTFAGCGGLENIEVESDNTAYCSVNNCLIEIKTKKLVAGCKNSIIPDDGSVTDIGLGAFSYTELTDITIPDGVTSIGDYAFFGCQSLTSVTLGNDVTDIGYFSFSECPALTSVTIGNSVTHIGNDAFHGCSSLTSVIIPDSVTSIGERAFYICSKLTNITIPKGVTVIGYCAFYGCTSLTSVTFENTSGWWLSESKNATNCINVSDPETAAKLLTEDYCYYTWKRS